jgi:hypothetical protein
MSIVEKTVDGITTTTDLAPVEELTAMIEQVGSPDVVRQFEIIDSLDREQSRHALSQLMFVAEQYRRLYHGTGRGSQNLRSRCSRMEGDPRLSSILSAHS